MVKYRALSVCLEDRRGVDAAPYRMIDSLTDSVWRGLKLSVRGPVFLVI